MKRVAPTGPRLALAAALSAATVALALASLGPDAALGAAAVLVALVVAIPFFEWTRVPSPLARALPRLVALILLVTALFAWLSRSVGTLVLDPALFPRVAGPVLLSAAVVFALAPRTFGVGRTLAPTIIGLLGVAGLDPSPEGYRGAALPFLKGSEHSAFAGYYLVLAVVVTLSLWASAILESGPRWSRRSLATLALSLAAAAALAATGVIGLPLLQPHVERAVASAFAEGTTGLGGGSTLGEFAELAVSRRRVLDLQTSLPEGGEWGLPSEVFTRFDGRRWSNPPPTPPGGSAVAVSPTVLRPAPVRPQTGPVLEGIGAWFEVAPAPAQPVELRITQAEVGSWPLLVPRGSAAVTADAWLLGIDRHGLLGQDGRATQSERRDQRTDPHPAGRVGEAGEDRPGLPRPNGPVGRVVEQVVLGPQRIEAGRLRHLRELADLRPAEGPLGRVELQADPKSGHSPHCAATACSPRPVLRAARSRAYHRPR